VQLLAAQDGLWSMELLGSLYYDFLLSVLFLHMNSVMSFVHPLTKKQEDQKKEHQYLRHEKHKYAAFYILRKNLVG
jgi:hypothetical protein